MDDNKKKHRFCLLQFGRGKPSHMVESKKIGETGAKQEGIFQWKLNLVSKTFNEMKRFFCDKGKGKILSNKVA